MKKLTYLVAVSMMMFMGVTFNSCGDDDDDPKTEQQAQKTDNSNDSGEDPSKNPEDDPGEKHGDKPGDGPGVKTIAEQKAYLDKVANALMDEVKSDNFKAIADLAKYVRETYVEGYNWGSVGDWARNTFETLRTMVGNPYTETEKNGPYEDYYNGGYYYYIYNKITTNYKATLLAANFLGHFQAYNERWERTDASDLQFIFNDQNGQQCVLKLTTSGAVKPVHIGKKKESEYNYFTNYYDNYRENVSERKYDYTDYTIGVPEKIEVTLTQGSSTVVKTTVNTDLSNLTGEEFDLSTSSLSMNALVELNNGYKVNVSQVAYTPNSKASASVVVTKNGKQLVSASVAGDVSGIPQANVSALVNGESNANFDNATGKNALAKIDVLGMFQLQGTLQDVRKLADYIKKAKDNKYNENTFKSYMEQANSLTTLNAYYDNTETVQATVKFEAFTHKEFKWNYNTKSYEEKTYWKMEPVLLFFDGSSYSLTMEAFFDKDDFKGVIDNFKRLTEDYADLIGDDDDDVNSK